MSETWVQFLFTQWWVFALLGGAAVLAFVIRGKADEEALKLLSNKLWGAGAAFAAWYSLQASTTNPYWGLGVGAGVVFAILTFVPVEYQRVVVRSENWGRLIVAVVVIGTFILLVMPSMTASQISNLVIGALVIGAIYLWSERKKLRGMEKPEEIKKPEKADIVEVEEEKVKKPAMTNITRRTTKGK